MNAMHADHVRLRGSDEAHRLGSLGSRMIPMFGGIGLIATAAGLVIGFMADDRVHFYRAYLMAYALVVSICLGALFFVILQHCVKAGWSVVIRRIAESVASNLMWLWIGFIPVLIGMKTGHLYDWVTHPGDPHLWEAAKYHWWLTPNVWAVRSFIYLILWAVLAWFFLKNSVAQDASGDVAYTRRMERFAPLAVGLYFVTQALAAMDWIMSLESHWFSTMFPVNFFAASCCGYFAVQILLMFGLTRGGKLPEISSDHFQDAGKLLFAFGIVFWAYIAFSQFMLIWYANLPEETTWYLSRWLGSWVVVSMALLVGHFMAPFVLLISRHPKRLPAALAGGAAFMLLMHFMDIYWLVMPQVPEHLLDIRDMAELRQAATNHDVGFQPTLIDLLLPVGMLGLIVAGAMVRLSGVSLLPIRDPRLHESLAFENI